MAGRPPKSEKSGQTRTSKSEESRRFLSTIVFLILLVKKPVLTCTSELFTTPKKAETLLSSLLLVTLGPKFSNFAWPPATQNWKISGLAGAFAPMFKILVQLTEKVWHQPLHDIGASRLCFMPGNRAAHHNCYRSGSKALCITSISAVSGLCCVFVCIRIFAPLLHK